MSLRGVIRIRAEGELTVGRDIVKIVVISGVELGGR